MGLCLARACKIHCTWKRCMPSAHNTSSPLQACLLTGCRDTLQALPLLSATVSWRACRPYTKQPGSPPEQAAQVLALPQLCQPPAQPAPERQLLESWRQLPDHQPVHGTATPAWDCCCWLLWGYLTAAWCRRFHQSPVYRQRAQHLPQAACPLALRAAPRSLERWACIWRKRTGLQVSAAGSMPISLEAVASVS